MSLLNKYCLKDNENIINGETVIFFLKNA